MYDDEFEATMKPSIMKIPRPYRLDFTILGLIGSAAAVTLTILYLVWHVGKVWWRSRYP